MKKIKRIGLGYILPICFTHILSFIGGFLLMQLFNLTILFGILFSLGFLTPSAENPDLPIIGVIPLSEGAVLFSTDNTTSEIGIVLTSSGHGEFIEICLLDNICPEVFIAT